MTLRLPLITAPSEKTRIAKALRTFSMLGKEPLSEVIQYDQSRLGQIGVTTDVLATGLTTLIKAAYGSNRPGDINALPITVELDGKRISISTTFGGLRSIPRCAFDSDPAQCNITNLINGRVFILQNSLYHSIKISDKVAHYIADHDFFGGFGCHGRVDPLDVAYALELINQSTYHRMKSTVRIFDPNLAFKNNDELRAKCDRGDD